jgi:hypothetical protein
MSSFNNLAEFHTWFHTLPLWGVPPDTITAQHLRESSALTVKETVTIHAVALIAAPICRTYAAAPALMAI